MHAKCLQLLSQPNAQWQAQFASAAAWMHLHCLWFALANILHVRYNMSPQP